MTDREKLEAINEVLKKVEATINDIDNDPLAKLTIWVAWDKVLTDIEKIVND